MGDFQKIAHWAVRGFAGILDILEDLAKQDLKLHPDTKDMLRGQLDHLEYIKLRFDENEHKEV